MSLLLCVSFVVLASQLCSATFLVDLKPKEEQRAYHHQMLVPYPRIGKRDQAPSALLKRQDFLNFLADSWQQTGSLRNAIREIQDMTESKRSYNNIIPGPRVGKRIPLARMG